MQRRARPWILALSLALSCADAGGDSGGSGPTEPPSGTADGGGESRPTRIFSLPYGERTVFVTADPSLELEVERLFTLLEDLRAESVEISARTQLPIGWTTLTFSVEGPYGERLVVREPDYDGDPESNTRPELSVSLEVLGRQRAVLERVGVAGEPIDFDQHVLTVRGVLEEQDLFLVRVRSPGGRLTGWRVAPLSGVVPGVEVESLPVHTILQRRPALLDAMLLPPGYMAYFSGDALTRVLNERDEVVWDLDQALARPSQPGPSPVIRPGAGPLLPPLGE